MAISPVGTKQLINVRLYDSEERVAGSVTITLSDPPRVKIGKCVDLIPTSRNYYSTASTNPIAWKITKTVGPGLKVEVGSRTVVDVILTQDVCIDYKTDWNLYWQREVTKIKFLDSDTASSHHSSLSGNSKLSSGPSIVTCQSSNGDLKICRNFLVIMQPDIPQLDNLTSIVSIFVLGQGPSSSYCPFSSSSPPKLFLSILLITVGFIFRRMSSRPIQISQHARMYEV